MEKMDKSLESVKRSFATVRTGRANPGMLDRIEVRPEILWGCVSWPEMRRAAWTFT